MRGVTRCGLLALCLSHCLVHLPDTTNLDISCAADNQCPNGERCVAKVCHVPGFVADTTPPSLVRASAANATSLLVVFSEPLASSLDSLHFAITPALGVSHPIVAADGVSMILATGLQIGERSYTVTVSGAADPSGNVATILSAAFNGFGAPPDATTPDVLSPSADYQTHDPSLVTLVWTARYLCFTYLVELATTPDFSTIAASQLVTPSDPANPSVSLASFGTLQPLDYYWRVSNAYSPPSAPQRITLEDPTAVYVSASAAPGGIGNQARPFGTINQAIIYEASTRTQSRSASDASPLGVRTIAIASGSYGSEVVAPVAGTVLRGGYDPVTWHDSASTPTTIVAPLSTAHAMVVAHAADVDVSFITFRFDQAATVAGQTILVNDSPGFVLADSVVHGPLQLIPAGVKIMATAGATILRSLIYGSGVGPVTGVDPGNFAAWASWVDGGVSVYDSTGIVIDSCEIHGSEGPAQRQTNGVRLNESEVLIRNSKIYPGQASSLLPDSGGSSSSALTVQSASSVVVEHSTISANEPDGDINDAPYESYALALDNWQGLSGKFITFSNSVIAGPTTYDYINPEVSLDCATPAQVTAYNNTFVALGSADQFLFQGGGDFRNNLFVRTSLNGPSALVAFGTDCDAPLPVLVGNVFALNDGTPGPVQSGTQKTNVFANGSTYDSPLHGHAIGSGGAGDPSGNIFVNLQTLPADAPALFLGKDYRLTTASPLYRMGVDLTGVAGFSDTTDRALTKRPAGGWTAGAYEAVAP